MRIIGIVMVMLVLTSSARPPMIGRAQRGDTWLDRTLEGWNTAGAAIPPPRASAGASPSTLEKCKMAPLPSGQSPDPSTAGASLSRVGWHPFLHQDSVLARQGIEIVAGLADVSPACEPVHFNLFVFVDGRYAGTLAPAPMTSARDGAIGAVRIVSATAITAEFARYAPNDSECCPSSRVKVAYRVDRGAAPVVTPVSNQLLR